MLFSQSELAELGADLAPQAKDDPEDEAVSPSGRTPPQQEPVSFDDLVESAFSDEETAEKQPAVSSDADLGAGFDGFVEAEPANTDEIMAAMAESEPISSAPVFQAAPHRPVGTRPAVGGVKSVAGEVVAAGSASTPPVTGDLPSVIFDDSPFLPEEPGQNESASIAPQLAALAAAVDAQQKSELPVSDTVLSSSPPPSANSLKVSVVNQGGGSLPSVQASAFVAISQTVNDGETGISARGDGVRAGTRPLTASSNTPVVSLDDHEFHVLEDSEERDSVPLPAAGIDPSGQTPPAAAELEASDGETQPGVAPEHEPEPGDEWATASTGEAELPVSSDGATADGGIDAAWTTDSGEQEMPPEAAEAAAEVHDEAEVHEDADAEVQEDADTVSDADADAEPVSMSEATEDELPLSSRVTPTREPPAAQRNVEITAAMSADAIGAALAQANLAANQAPASQPPAAAAPIQAPQTSQATPPRVEPRRLNSLPPTPPPTPAVKPPPMPPVAVKPPPPPPAPPPAAPPAQAVQAKPALPPAPAPPPPNFGEETKLRKKRRSKQWFEEIFDDDYLHTLPFMTPQQTEREVALILETLELPQNGRVLDLGCGYGRHAMEMAARGYRTVGLDLSLPLLIRATDAARRVGVSVDFVHGDMRDMTFENEFDGAYCFFTTFGYFDDDTNRRVAANIGKALKPGGRLLLDLINRDYLIGDLPTRVWWQGDGCVVLEEVDFNYFTSRLQVQRQIILEDGRQLEQEISIRAYSLHEIGKVLHHAGFRVLEVSGGLELRGRFYGNESRQLVVLAEKRADAG